MAQEEQGCSNSSSGGGRFLKKPKQKIPQRGLGVAQLEKIRLEEQKKKDAASAATTSSTLPSPSLPFLQPPALDLNTGLHNSIFKSSSMPISNLEFFTLPLPPPPPPPPPPPYAPELSNRQLGDARHRSLPMIWTGSDSIHGPESAQKLEPIIPFHRRLLHDESNSVWQFQQNYLQHDELPPSLVDTPSLPCLSTGINFHIESPSIHSYCNNLMPSRPQDEEKMVGMKRRWPFSFDNPPTGEPFHCKFPPSSVPPSDRWDRLSNSQDTFKFEAKNAVFRERPSSSRTNEIAVPNAVIKSSGALDGGVLTLGPPNASSNLTSKQPISNPASHSVDFDLLPFQGTVENPFSRRPIDNEEQKRPFYSFLPIRPTIRSASSSDWRGGVVEGVDLNLKL